MNKCMSQSMIWSFDEFGLSSLLSSQEISSIELISSKTFLAEAIKKKDYNTGEWYLGFYTVSSLNQDDAILKLKEKAFFYFKVNFFLFLLNSNRHFCRTTLN